MADAMVGNVAPRTGLEPGHLVFDANFESGNLGRADELSQGEYDLFVRPDTCNAKYRVWFFFRASNALAGQRVVFNVVNFSKLRNLFDTGCASPVFRESRIAAKNIFYYRSRMHGGRFILSFVHVFAAALPCDFAYCIPYTYTELQTFLAELDQRQLPFYRREMLCRTVQKRRVDLLTISAAENLAAEGAAGRREKVVFLTARVHPGESPSSHVLRGLLQFLLGDSRQARRLRQLLVFKVVPMLNPDGVYLGNYRCSLLGFDLNRQWQHPSVWAHPSIAAAKALLLHLHSPPRSEIVLCFDLHAHSQRTNSFLYGNLISASPRQFAQQLYIPYLLAELSEDFSLRHTQFNTDAEKAGTNRRAMGELLDGACLCYTLEVSFFSYRPHDADQEPPVFYYEPAYENLGKNLVLSMLKYHDVLADNSRLHIDRDFRTFLSKRCQRTYRAGTEEMDE